MTTPLRPCPLLERHSPTVPLDHAPPPWLVRRCEETGFVFLANPPVQERFCDEFAWEVTHAEESYRRRRDEPMLYAISSGLKTFRQRFLKRDKVSALVRGLVREFGSDTDGPLRLVDVGCAAGKLALRVARGVPQDIASRLEPVGIEISTHLAGIADSALGRLGGRCIHGTGIDGLRQLDRGSVHIVVLSCVLEHEIDPLPLLRQCRERLTHDGRIVVKVPNYASVGRHLRGRRWCGYRWPDHVNYFTPKTLSAIAAAAGLKVIRMNAFDRSPLSDSLYAILGRDAPAAGTAAHRGPPPLRRAA
jgi:SAM-dependent methyltransferase